MMKDSLKHRGRFFLFDLQIRADVVKQKEPSPMFEAAVVTHID
jgi:hypothetical protein